MAIIAFLVGPDFEDSELRIPYDALRAAGHTVELLGTRSGETLRGKKGVEKVEIEASTTDRKAELYDAVVIPGGYSPDHLRTDEHVVDFVRDFAATGRTLAAVCHGPQLLIEAGVARGKHLTSWPSVKTDLVNAGAAWTDEEVVVDGSLVTSRKPDDLPAFTRAILERLPRRAQTVS